MRKTMKRWLTLFLVASMPLAVVACGDEPEEPDDGDDGTDEAAYALSVDDQDVTSDPSTVTVDWVDTDGEGLWVVVHADNAGEPGEVLGWSWVEGSDERSQDIDVSLQDEAADGQTLWAMLHTDDGNGDWDDPETDPAAEVDGEVVQDSFTVSIDDDGMEDNTPAISVDDQTLMPDSADWVDVSEATIDEPGFVVIHADAEDSPGEVLGWSDVLEPGTSNDIRVTLDRDVEDGEKLWAMLHYDDGNEEWDDPETDTAVEDENGDIVMAWFEVTVEDDGGGGTALLEVSNQVVAADAPNRVVIDEVSYEENGFLVVHADDGGSPGDILGASELLAGDDSPHENVWVDLDRPVEGAETLHAMVHSDDDDNGEWNADNDPAVEHDGDIAVEAFDVWAPGVEASDLTLNGDDGDLSTIVTVDNVVSDRDGWLVIHEGSCDDFGGVLGWAWVDEGWSNENVTVELSAPAADGGANADLCGMLHEDDGNEEYDFDAESRGTADGPVTDQNDEIVMSTFNVSVTEGTPAIRITLGADGTESYTVDNVEPARFQEEDIGKEDDDPTFEFRTGWRYEFENTATENHPFDLVDGGPAAAPPTNDTVHLSQAEEGMLEDDGSINWWEEETTFRFTVSTSFVAAIDLYRCNEHIGPMRGPVSTK